jgi:CRISPR-associated protein Cmr3
MYQQATVTVFPHDPIIARDGRPFGFGEHVRCLDWLYPSVLAGSLRSLAGKLLTAASEANAYQRAKDFLVAGPLPCDESSGKLFVPAPRDLLAYQESGGQKIMTLKPVQPADSEGCDLPSLNLWPMQVTSTVKPDQLPPFWSLAKMTLWLTQNPPATLGLPASDEKSDDFLPAFPKEERVHVKIDPKTSTSTSDDAEGQLFTTQSLTIFNPKRPLCLAARTSCKDRELHDKFTRVQTLYTIGGERRLAQFKGSAQASAWDCPQAVKDALKDAKNIRMVLATPAIFGRGWLPAWLDPQKTNDLEILQGRIPRTDVYVQLRGACVDRWRPLSGWIMNKSEKSSPGPKRIKRLAPAGSVYFFEIVKGDPQELAKLWLESVSDDPQGRMDGFGLTLWGIWNRETR